MIGAYTAYHMIILLNTVKGKIIKNDNINILTLNINLYLLWKICTDITVGFFNCQLFLYLTCWLYSSYYIILSYISALLLELVFIFFLELYPLAFGGFVCVTAEPRPQSFKIMLYHWATLGSLQHFCKWNCNGKLSISLSFHCLYNFLKRG